MSAIADNPTDHRFECTQDGHRAVLDYRMDGDRLILDHTGVPEELGGQGIGGRLVQAAIERARAEGLTVVPLCTYARSWIGKHPDETAGVTIDLDTTE
jgi:predicted GNAT family acetyltransferase